MIKDAPVFIDLQNKTSAEYNSESIVSLSAGIDGSLWALLYEVNATDFSVAKWQTIAKKWYRVDGQRGINLAAYNEISVAVVSSNGLLKISSSL